MWVLDHCLSMSIKWLADGLKVSGENMMVDINFENFKIKYYLSNSRIFLKSAVLFKGL
jgi:hypothetical protein